MQHGIEFKFPEEYEKYWCCWYDSAMIESGKKEPEVIDG